MYIVRGVLVDQTGRIDTAFLVQVEEHEHTYALVSSTNILLQRIMVVLAESASAYSIVQVLELPSRYAKQTLKLLQIVYLILSSLNTPTFGLLIASYGMSAFYNITVGMYIPMVILLVSKQLSVVDRLRETMDLSAAGSIEFGAREISASQFDRHSADLSLG
ncbi:hypothetical protein DXG01_013070 [Tephrocybe rancida]|nr:hypothetical protein DXG01_013070 [Tephrocybe rancida]